MLEIILSDPFTYVYIFAVFLFLLIGGLIVHLGPYRRTRRALFMTALMGAASIILNLLAITLTQYYSEKIVLQGYTDYGVVVGQFLMAAWYLEFWFFLQYMLESRWESRETSFTRHYRRTVRLVTLAPIILWIILVVCNEYIFKISGIYIRYYSFKIPIYFHLIFIVLYIFPFFFICLRKAEQDGDRHNDENQRRLIQWVGLALRSLGCGILTILGPELGNIIIMVFLAAILAKYIKSKPRTVNNML